MIREVIVISPGVAAIPPVQCDVESDGAHENTDIDVDVTAFDLDGFSDFQLDLSCLSPVPSPPASISSSSHSAHSPPASPRSSKSVSFSSSTHSPTPQSRTTQKLPSPKLSPVTATSIVRGSWPLIRYVGRGTPIDRSRRIEWGGHSGDEVTEDGMLFSTVRSSSLDSALRTSHRSISPDWNVVAPASAPYALSPLQINADSRGSTLSEHTIRPAGQIQIDGLSSDPAEWASFMESVLGPVASSSSSNSHAATLDMSAAVDTPNNTTFTTEQIEEFDTVLDMDLGLDAALDLGLGLGRGMNWFELGVLPGSGRASPSVYSSPPPTPHISPSPSEDGSETGSTSTKAEVNPEVELKSGSQPWWQKALKRLLRVRRLFRSRGGKL
jgi:hypothetical protein